MDINPRDKCVNVNQVFPGKNRLNSISPLHTYNSTSDHRRRPETSIQIHLFVEQIKVKIFDILFSFNFEVPLCHERRNLSKE